MDKTELQNKMHKITEENPTSRPNVTKIFNAWRSNTSLNQDYDILSCALDAFADVGVETVLSIIDAFGRLKVETNGAIAQEQFVRMFRDTINLKRSTTGDMTGIYLLNMTSPKKFTQRTGKNVGREGMIMNLVFYAGGQITSLTTSDESWMPVLNDATIGKSYSLPLTMGANGRYYIAGDPILREVPPIASDADIATYIKSQYIPLSLDVDLTSYINSEQRYCLTGFIVSPRKTPYGWTFNFTDENKKSDMPIENSPNFWFASVMSIHDMDRVLIVAKVVKGREGPSISAEFIHVLNTLHKSPAKPPTKGQSPIPPNMDPSSTFNPPAQSPAPQPQPVSAPVPPAETTSTSEFNL